MPSDLLQTKLFVPLPRPGLVNRPHLAQQLHDSLALGARIFLISAPAGFGKTSLVTQWIHTSGWPAGWLALEAADNHPIRFFRYLAAAFQKALPSLHIPMPDTQTAQLDVEGFITELCNVLTTSPGPFMLVLDDYHLITEPALQQAMQQLIAALPQQARLVLVTRQDPALPVARLRALGQLVEVRSSGLMFSNEEAAGFLNQVMRLGLEPHQVSALVSRTEGWAAGLQMAAISMRGVEDREGFIEAFSGSNRFVLDYLMEEVLDRQPPEVVVFLLRTSLLQRFNASLCQAMLHDLPNPPEAIKLIDYLDRANLFLVPLDNERQWYRYHHLFATLLQTRIRAHQPDIVPELMRRASLWFEANGDPKSALDYALVGQDYLHAADLLDQNLNVRWRLTDMDFLMSINQLPENVLLARPSLCLQAAWIHVILGKIDQVARFVEAAERLLAHQPDSKPTLQQRGQSTFAQVLRAYLDDFGNRSPSLNFSPEEAISAIPGDNVGMRNSIAVVLGTIYYMEGSYTTAARCFNDAIQRDKQAEGTNAVPIAASRWARMLLAQGKLREAAALCEENLAYIQERGITRFYVAGNLHAMLSELYRQWNQLAQANQHIEEWLKLHERWPTPQAMLLGISALLRLRLAQGDFQAAGQAFQQGQRIIETAHIYPDMANNFNAAAVHYWAATNNTPALEQWAQRHAALNGEARSFRNEIPTISLARAWLFTGKAAQALPLLHQAAENTENGERSGHLIEILTLLAAFLPPEQAPNVLEKALRLAMPQGHQRVFLDLGTALSPRLEALQHALAPEDQDIRAYIQMLLKGHKQPPISQEASFNRPDSGMIEPLSKRELEILLLVAEGLTNQQIASRLVISIRTVKKHLENINGKLGVNSRVKAIARARELKIISFP
jgi:LuxR family transcriptional regulator, maltose regulon positive regulatory protein